LRSDITNIGKRATLTRTLTRAGAILRALRNTGKFWEELRRTAVEGQKEDGINPQSGMKETKELFKRGRGSIIKEIK